MGTIRLRHGDGIVALAFSPDGQTLATSGDDGIVRLWESATGKEVRRFGGHGEDVNSLAVRCPFDWDKNVWLKDSFPEELDLGLIRDFE